MGTCPHNCVMTMPLKVPDLYFDPRAVSEILELTSSNGKCLIIELYDLCAEISPKIIDEIEAAYRSRDGVGVQQKAHLLKSSSANLGLRLLSAQCSLLEHTAHSNFAAVNAGTIQRLRECLENSLAQLKSYIETLGDS